MNISSVKRNATKARFIGVSFELNLFFLEISIPDIKIKLRSIFGQGSVGLCTNGLPIAHKSDMLIAKYRP